MKYALELTIGCAMVTIGYASFIWGYEVGKEDVECPRPPYQGIDESAIGVVERYREYGNDYVVTQESFHDYIVVNGERVIHINNCKCKTHGTKKD